MRTCAIVGCGRIVEELHLPALAGFHDVGVEAFVDSNVERARRLAAAHAKARVFASHGELMKCRATRPTFVIVATPGFTHYAIVMDLVRAGFNLVVEKPLALRLEEVSEIQQAAKQSGVVVGVLHNYRYRSPVMEARRALTEGVIGEVKQVNATFHGQAIHGEATPWSWAERRNRVLLFEQCVHFLDLMCLFAGPHKQLLGVRRKIEPSLDVTSNILALVEFAGGAVGIVDFQLYSSSNYTHVEVFGTANDVLIKFFPHYYRVYSGTVNPLDEVFFDLRRVWGFGVEAIKSALNERGVKRRALSHHLYFADYLKALEAGRPPPVDIEAVLPTMKLADAIAKHVYETDTVAAAEMGSSGAPGQFG